MNLRTYHAYSMAEALEAVKRDLGADAVILHTRTFRRGGVLGIGAKQIVEVTAADALPLASEDVEVVPAGAARDGRNGRAAVASVSATMADVAEAKRAGAPTVATMQARRAYVETGRTQGASLIHSQAAQAQSQAQANADAEAVRSRVPNVRAAPVPARAAAEKAAKPHAPVVSVPAPAVEEKPLAAARAGAAMEEKVVAVRANGAPAKSVAAPVPGRAIAPQVSSVAAPVAEPVITHPVRKWVPEPIAPAQARQAASLRDGALRESSLREGALRDGALREHSQHTNAAPVAKAPVANAPVAKAAAAMNASKGVSTPSTTPPPVPRIDDTAAQAMQDELAAIRNMVGQVLQRQVKTTGKATPGVPRQLFDMYLQLIAHDLAEDLADDVVAAVAKTLPPDKLDDADAVRGAVLDALAQHIPMAAPTELPADRAADGRPLTIALVGPTGVGKTTTLAKLAASFKLHQKKSVGLVTCDTYRIAAVDQLTTYAKIIGVPLRVARTPEEMRLAVAEFASCDVVLIDTAGRGQRDSERISELRELVLAANPHEVHLVLSSTANEKVLLSEAEAFAPLGAEKIVLTKLDEAVSFGMLVNVLRTVGKRLSFVTTGQEVPDDFELASANRLAELVLCGGHDGVEPLP